MRTCRLRLGIVAAWFGALTIAATPPAAAEYPPQVGQPHPDFVLPRIDNREAVSLAQFRGRKLLLIHFASW